MRWSLSKQKLTLPKISVNGTYLILYIASYGPLYDVPLQTRHHNGHRYIKRDVLNHWSLVMPICVGKLTIIGSDNGFSPGRWQVIIYTNAGTNNCNLSEILSEIDTFSFKKMHLKMSSAKWWQFCLSLNESSLPCLDIQHNDKNRCGCNCMEAIH